MPGRDGGACEWAAVTRSFAETHRPIEGQREPDLRPRDSLLGSSLPRPPSLIALWRYNVRTLKPPTVRG